MDVEDDESCDSDYDPTKDAEADVDEEDGKQGEKGIQNITFMRRRAAADIWEQINAEDVVFRQGKVENSYKTSSSSKPSEKGKAKKSDKSNLKEAKRAKKAQKMLAGIFVGKVARKLVGGAVKTVKKEKDAALAERAKQSAKAVQKKEKIVETKKFAGREIKIQRTLRAGEKDALPQVHDM